MNNSKVKTCDCCGKPVTQMPIAPIPLNHKRRFLRQAKSKLKKLGLNGEFALAATDELIVGISYTYSADSEFDKCDLLCDAMSELAWEYQEKLICQSEIHYYPV